MTPLQNAFFIIGIVVATIAFGFIFLGLIVPVLARIVRLVQRLPELANKSSVEPVFVYGGFLFVLFGFALLCVSTTWLAVTNLPLFCAGIGCLVTGYSALRLADMF